MHKLYNVHGISIAKPKYISTFVTLHRTNIHRTLTIATTASVRHIHWNYIIIIKYNTVLVLVYEKHKRDMKALSTWMSEIHLSSSSVLVRVQRVLAKKFSKRKKNQQKIRFNITYTFAHSTASEHPFSRIYIPCVVPMNSFISPNKLK